MNETMNRPLLIIMIIALAFLLITNLILVYFLVANNEAYQQVITELKNQPEEINNQPTEEQDSESTDIIVQNPDATTTKGNSLGVIWNSNMVNASWYSIQIEADEIKDPGLLNNANLYHIGQINGGQYDNFKLYLLDIEWPNEDMWVSGSSKYYLISDGVYQSKAIVLTKHSEAYPEEYQDLFVLNDQLSLQLPVIPNEISIPNSTHKLILQEMGFTRILSQYSKIQYVFEDSTGIKVYFDSQRNCYLIILPDFSIRQYALALPFAQALPETTDYNPTSILNIIWDDQIARKNEYVIRNYGGCGFSGCNSYPQYTITINDLKVAGKTSTGENIYELKDQSFKVNYIGYSEKKELLQTIYDNHYPGYVDGDILDKKPYDQFINDKPLIFWQDPFGKIMEFTRTDYMPAVECGKPVIYLYPKKTMDVAVSVAPEGGISVSEPLHNDGWLVKAEPNGTLLNYSDQKQYDYLFWEGYGYKYQRPNNGFVVSEDKVESFFRNTLNKLGMIEKETNDFLEFWLPKFVGKPYYFITFIPQAEFDRIAPLTVNPNPDTVIRIFMDYEGLDYPIKVNPQNIVTPARNGFTVVEWGGALHD